jgi:hypothetical protein
MAAIAEHDPLTNWAFGVARVARPVLDGDCPVKARQPQAPETTTLAALLPVLWAGPVEPVHQRAIGCAARREFIVAVYNGPV